MEEIVTGTTATSHTTVIFQTMGDFFSNIVVEMIPFCCVALPLIILSIYYSKKRADYHFQNDNGREFTVWSTIKSVFGKVFNYTSWIFLATSLSCAFSMPSLSIIIMAVIYGIEVLKMLDKYCESKGFDIDEVGLMKLVFKYIWSRLTGNFDEDFNDVIKKQNVRRKKKENKRR